MNILVFNAGSSTLKFSLYSAAQTGQELDGMVDWAGQVKSADCVIRVANSDESRTQIGVTDHASAVTHVVQKLSTHQICAVGHRVVHGGVRFQQSTLVDAQVKTEIEKLSALAPLHNPPALRAIEAAEAALPNAKQVAVFDTAFFQSLPLSARVFPLPYEWYSEWGIQRFGFHGISHAYCAGRAVEMLGADPKSLRLVICHLGNGCSATAVRDGVPTATTMGFTPLDGLMMGTRPGSLDPGVLLHVQKCHSLKPSEVDQLLNHQSGLLGVSGTSADFRAVEKAAQQGSDRARLALEMYADRIRSGIGALAVAMGGVDALVFTAGVGENSASLRATVCAGLECLGLFIDASANSACSPDMDIARTESPHHILVIHTREDLMIARETKRLTHAGGDGR